MSYQQIIDEKIGTVYRASVATKIMQHMGRIRNSSDLNQARRWVMELLQNARDVAWPDEPVKVVLELSEKELKFAHTGQPFHVKDILSIVNQVSSKVDDENTVGQFGTGFVTTFQLSEKVNLRGVLKEETEQYKAFEVCIDRRGNSQEEILSAINGATEVLRQVDMSEEVRDYRKDSYNTVFTYELDNERSKSIARTGMDDLRETVFFVLLFSEKIGSIELKYILGGQKKCISYTKIGNKPLGELLQCAEFLCTETGKESETIQICYAKDGKMTLAATYSDDRGFLSLSEKCPRLFVDFPLIGAENFCFPIVINSLEFEPNEPRSGISLVDNETSIDAKTNKKVMEQAVVLYKAFVAEALLLSLNGMEHIFQIPFYQESKEWSECWIKEHIYGPLYGDIVSREFLETEVGKKAIAAPDLFLVQGEDARERASVRELLSSVKDIYYPVDEVDWYSVFAAYDFPEVKVYGLKKLLEQAEGIIRQIGKIDEARISPVKWCEKLYYYALQKEELARSIRAGEIAIFPNQKLEQERLWNLRKIQDISVDPGIPEILKDVVEILDKIPPQNNLSGMTSANLRENLLHKDFLAGGLAELPIYDWGRLGNYIATKTSDKFLAFEYYRFGSAYKERWKQAWIMMACCGPDKGMYDLISQCFSTPIPEYHSFETALPDSIWRNSYYGLLQICIKEIAWYPKVDDLPWGKREKCGDIYAWLNLFYEKWLYYRHGDEDGGAIYLNQEGVFKNRFNLRQDNIESEELKKIAYELRALSENCNFYRQLLHKQIIVTGLVQMEYQNRDVAMELNRVVTLLLNQRNLSEAPLPQQEACSALLAWIQNHLKEAEEYFPSFSSEEGQMKLLTPKAAVRMHQKVQKLEHVMEVLNCTDEDELLQILQEYSREKKDTQRHGIREALDGDVIFDTNLLAALGIAEDDDESFRRVCKEIGIAGERYALEQVKEHFLKQNMQVICDNGDEIILRDKEDETKRAVTLYYPDNASYHQRGWDICIKDSSKGDVCEYLEVKTHTSRSYVRNTIRLSNEQMKKAILEGKYYHVLVVVYDFLNKKGQEILWYDGFLGHVASGTLKHATNDYIFAVEK